MSMYESATMKADFFVEDYKSRTPKYKKKSKYKGKKRSDHKHSYKYVRLSVPFTNPYTQEVEYRDGLGQVCKKCGYIHRFYILWGEDSKEDKLWNKCDEEAYICNFDDKYITI